jgi:hypothetical protein
LRPGLADGIIGYEDQRAHLNEDAQQHIAVWILVVPENLSHLKTLDFSRLCRQSGRYCFAAHIPPGAPVEILPIVINEVTCNATCRVCAVGVSRRVFPVTPLHAAGDPGIAALASGLPAIGAQAAYPAD